MIIKQHIDFIDLKPDVGQSVRSTGSSGQLYGSASGEYFPDRAVVPLVLTPIITWVDETTGESSDNAAKDLTDGKWYRLDQTTTGGLVAANEISSGATLVLPDGTTTARFVIDATPGSATYGQLTIRENTPAGSTVTYVFKATLAVGEPREVCVSFDVSTISVDVVPSLMFDNSEQGLYNPWSSHPTFDITPSVTPSGYTAKFKWQSLHGTTWADVGVSQYDWALKVDAATGKLTINRALMQDELTLKCIASVNISGNNVDISRLLTHKRRLPNFEAEIQEDPLISRGEKKVQRSIRISTASGDIANADGELDIRWKNSAKTLIAQGQTVDINLSSLKADNDVVCEINDRGGWCLAELDNGDWLKDNDDKVLLIR